MLYDFSAKIIFQFRSEKNNISNKKRFCEERIVLIRSENKNKAYNNIFDYAKNEEIVFVDNEYFTYFEFIGFISFLRSDYTGSVIIEANIVTEIWHGFYEKLIPMERKKYIVKPKNKLEEFVRLNDSAKNKIKIF